MSALSLSIAESRPLRPYQESTIEMLRAGVKSGNRRQVAKLPTGAGKTRIAGELIKRALGRGERSIFVVQRLSLIEQTVAAFEGHIGVIQGQNFRTDTSAPVQIASAQTLARREIPQSGLVIIDECHSGPKRLTIGFWTLRGQKQNSSAYRRRHGPEAWASSGKRWSLPSRLRSSFKTSFSASFASWLRQARTLPGCGQPPAISTSGTFPPRATNSSLLGILSTRGSSEPMVCQPYATASTGNMHSTLTSGFARPASPANISIVTRPCLSGRKYLKGFAKQKQQ